MIIDAAPVPCEEGTGERHRDDGILSFDRYAATASDHELPVVYPDVSVKDEFDVATTVSARPASSVCHFSRCLSTPLHAPAGHRHTYRTPSMVSMSRKTSSRVYTITLLISCYLLCKGTARHSPGARGCGVTRQSRDDLETRWRILINGGTRGCVQSGDLTTLQCAAQKFCAPSRGARANSIARSRFELLSRDPESRMIDRYTTGLFSSVCNPTQY